MTATGAALNHMANNMFTGSAGDRSSDPNYVILFTDGYSNIDEDSTIPAAMTLKGMQTTIFVVGLGKEDCLDPEEIRGIASSPANSYSYFMFKNNTMSNVVNGILGVICAP